MDRISEPFTALLPTAQLGDVPLASWRGAVSGGAQALPSSAEVGKLIGFDALEQPIVGKLARCPGLQMPARTTVALRSAMVGCDVVVLFASGQDDAPIIVGVIDPPSDRPDPAETAAGFRIAVDVDDQRLVLRAERELRLHCGKASITLTRSGKVLIEGTYVLSRSLGYNKIKGAAIELN